MHQASRDGWPILTRHRLASIAIYVHKNNKDMKICESQTSAASQLLFLCCQIRGGLFVFQVYLYVVFSCCTVLKGQHNDFKWIITIEIFRSGKEGMFEGMFFFYCSFNPIKKKMCTYHDHVFTGLFIPPTVIYIKTV